MMMTTFTMANVVGAYLNSDMDQFTLMKLTGEAVDIMVSVDPLYNHFGTKENSKPVLYLQLKKAVWLYQVSTTIV
jgi:hypothetical protein